MALSCRDFRCMVLMACTRTAYDVHASTCTHYLSARAVLPWCCQIYPTAVDACGVCGGCNASCLGCDGVPNRRYPRPGTPYFRLITWLSFSAVSPRAEKPDDSQSLECIFRVSLQTSFHSLHVANNLTSYVSLHIRAPVSRSCESDLSSQLVCSH